jgi:hypothetical protein
MYFGDFKYIQDCLYQGLIQWEGIARNVEYLGLSADIKIFLGNWYHAWLNPDREEETCSDDDGDDSDTIFSDSDDDDYPTDLEDIIETDNEKHGFHGRTIPVSFQSFQSLR